ncbi:MAG TPA: VWA domain-containing protein [Actinomycetota bacterium]|nr:VWA domain-containing protein [Actinomycetota bacterium]
MPAPPTDDPGGLPDPLGRLVGFGRYLRSVGLEVGTGRILAFCRAAALLDPFDRTDLFLAARATLVSRREDFALLEAAFQRYFGAEGWQEPEAPAPEARRRPEASPPEEGAEPSEEVVAASAWSVAGEDEEEAEESTAVRIVASRAEVLRGKDFAQLTEDERREVLALIRRMAPGLPLRRSRRLRPAPAGPRFDVRRTLRNSLRTEGEPFRRAWRERRVRPRPLVLILDVSGSMAPYSRPLVEFAHAAATAGRRVEVFCFGTRLTRVTRALRTRDPDAALRAVAETVVDWEGGTRIGDSLQELLRRWASRSALRGAVVVLCSDGLERGDPELLRRQVERLARLAHRLVWVNPLKGSPRYEPLARGMAAALPHVDAFLPGHNLASLEALTAAIAA